MKKSTRTRTRRVRRQGKATLKHGKAAKRSHRRVAGRSGSIMSKRLESRRDA